ncbi:DUF3383 family protein [Lentilactobacillus sp. SPB1-3]|uniref:DUF3383 family protein n=1 Tax=Lentilactobacillus terminaliae TaxID=3003483 RepID=A0ACD5DD12_9LACO|nr:DUF3383 family protein [Lentilactobacillus sp. SPB1-3]MCZ0978091.1 DUF3383 family protein [Lentilactobacillus sp. SPB1-3]
MADTLFSTLSRISPAHISNQFVTEVQAPFAGVLVKGTKQGIKVYSDLDSVTDDYEMYSSLWKKARAYFAANGEASSLLVLTYAPGDTQQVVAPTGITTTPTKDGAVVKADAVVTNNSNLSADAIGAVTALKKYYYAGPQFWMLAEFDDEVSHAVSNFVELQNTGVYVAYTNDATKLQTYTDNKKTLLLTLPSVDDSTADTQDTYNNVFDAALVGTVYGRKPHSAWKYALGGLPYTKPQDRFDFTPDDQADLDKYNIVTYAYVLDSPRVTSSRTAASGMHIDIILGWDWIQNEIQTRIANLFIQNAKQGIPYSEVGFDSIINVIRGVFIDAADLDIIAPELDVNGSETGKPKYSVDYVEPGLLPKSYETKREMRGIKTSYQPMGMIEDAYIENTIVM